MFTASYLIQSESEGLTLREVLQNIPLDPASVFVYLLLAGAVLWVIWGSRRRGKPSA